MQPFRTAFRLVGEFRKPYVILNALFYGVILCGMIYGAINHDAIRSLGDTLRSQAADSLPGVAEAYQNGHILTAIALTWATARAQRPDPSDAELVPSD